MESLPFPNQLAFHTPAWRWKTALASAQSERFQPFADAGVQAAQRFWHQWSRCHNDDDRNLVALRMPNVYWAFITLFQDTSEFSKAAIEARILANEPHHSMTRKTGIPAAMLQTFEDLFFDVRRYLDHPDYILNTVIGREMCAPRKKMGIAVMWKFFAYRGGVAVLDALMDVGRAGSSKPASLEAVEQFFREDTAEVLRRKIAIAARVVDADFARTAKVLVAAMTGDVAKKEEERLGALEKGALAFLKSMGRLVGNEKATTPADQRLEEFERSAVELRDQDLPRVGRGEDTRDLEELRTLKIPPPAPQRQAMTGRGQLPFIELEKYEFDA